MTARAGLIPVLAALAMGATACYHYATQRAPLGGALAKPQERVRVTLLDSTQLVLYSAMVTGDSLIGWSAPPDRAGGLGRVALAVAAVQRVEVYRLSVVPTLAAGAASAVLLVGLAIAAGFFLFVTALKGLL